MFILNCPSCGHRSKVKFARMGATAKCVACGEAFVVEAGTLDMQGKAGDAAEAKAAPPAKVVQEHASMQELVVERPPLAPPGNPVVGEGTYSSAPPPPPSFFRRLDPVLVGLFVMLVIGTVALLFVMLRGDDADLAGDGPPPVAVNPQPGTPSPDATAVTPAPSPGTTPAVTQNPATPGIPGAPQPVVDPAPNLPTMPLYASLGYQPNWAIIDPPRDPALPMMDTGGLLWLPRIEKQPGGEGLFTAIFMAGEPMVYGSGFLQVQMINPEGRVYAEMKQTVPILPVRQAVQMRVPVSAAMMGPFDRMVAEFTPLDPLEDAVPLELAASQTRVLSQSGASGGPLVQVSLANPFSFAVTNPTIVLGILSADGWPLGEWRGTMEGQIAPHGTLTFKTSPPLPGDAQAARVVLRGYARKQ